MSTAKSLLFATGITAVFCGRLDDYEGFADSGKSGERCHHNVCDCIHRYEVLGWRIQEVNGRARLQLNQVPAMQCRGAFFIPKIM